MTKEEIVKEYIEMLHVIDISSVDEFKKFVEKNNNIMSIGDLTIASSIIAVFDMLDKK